MNLSKEDLLYHVIYRIANDFLELSHEKVMSQRNEYVKWARVALQEYHRSDEPEPTKELKDDF